MCSSDLLAAGAGLATADFVISPIVACFMGAARFSTIWVWHQTRHTFRLTRELQAAVLLRQIRGKPGADKPEVS